MFCSLRPQSCPSQGRGQIFVSDPFPVGRIRGLSECHHSHTFRPSNMNCNFGDPYGTFGHRGAENLAVRGDFAIALINLCPIRLRAASQGLPALATPPRRPPGVHFRRFLWPRSENDDFGPPGAHFRRFCGLGPKTTISDFLGAIFADSAA